MSSQNSPGKAKSSCNTGPLSTVLSVRCTFKYPNRKSMCSFSPPPTTPTVRRKGPEAGGKAPCSAGCPGKATHQHTRTHAEPRGPSGTQLSTKACSAFEASFPHAISFSLHAASSQALQAPMLLPPERSFISAVPAKLKASIKTGNKTHRGDTTARSQVTHSYLIAIGIVALHLSAAMPWETKKTKSNSANIFSISCER